MVSEGDKKDREDKGETTHVRHVPHNPLQVCVLNTKFVAFLAEFSYFGVLKEKENEQSRVKYEKKEDDV